MTWERSRPATPMTLEEWMDYVDRAIIKFSGGSSGIGKTLWFEAEYDVNKFRQISSFQPAWRRLPDGRIELRGRLMKYTIINNVVTNVPLVSGDVIMKIPFECCPPSNEQHRSSITALAPCSISNGNPGVFRIDIQREAAWGEHQAEDDNGDPLFDGDGLPVIENSSMTEIIARPPAEKPITQWVGFDGVIYDPFIYLDSLPPVPVGQKPLVNDHGYVAMQHQDGRVEWIIPGINYSSG